MKFDLYQTLLAFTLISLLAVAVYNAYDRTQQTEKQTILINDSIQERRQFQEDITRQLDLANRSLSVQIEGDIDRSELKNLTSLLNDTLQHALDEAGNISKGLIIRNDTYVNTEEIKSLLIKHMNITE